ncbi:diguanylate cyclase (GGDEF)-like protein/PAS domain S-box-containing protein [Nakamurella sp. UYEF19]|uniref:putative bifunctional diguanylate cyclase/phosphodiesterase n=1 Tax=Nakamurella sp. UYEF19 TaxID=1756392 RepID=UPI003390EB37
MVLLSTFTSAVAPDGATDSSPPAIARTMLSLSDRAASDVHGPTAGIETTPPESDAATELTTARDTLRKVEAQFDDLFDYAPNGMMMLGTDPSCPARFLRVNPALCRLTGYTADQLLEMTLADLTHPEHEGTLHKGKLEDRSAVLAEQRPAERWHERRWIGADQLDLWVHLTMSPSRGTGPGCVIGQVENITARKHVETRLRPQVLHDELTGLPNRVLLMDHLEHALAEGIRSGRHVGLLTIGIDGFKSVNTTWGRPAGDRILGEVVERLRLTIRPGDILARLGGDEFVIGCVALEGAEAAAKIAERVLAALHAPHHDGSDTFTLGASIGVSVSSISSDPGQLLRESAEAMREVKRTGKNAIRLGGIDDPAVVARTARAVRRIRIESELRLALANDELILFGQPIYDISTGRVIAVENLLRWLHPVRGLLGPGEFLDVAEGGDLMIPIGRRVIDESCRMAARWAELLGPDAPEVHVNISGRQLGSGDLGGDVLAAMERHGLPPEHLVLELTETHMPMVADSLRRDLLDLRAHGISVAIDDLGTGYSSLTRITELPVDMLKIDIRFVAGLGVDPSCDAVVRGILAIGRALGMTVVAEGVETQDQADLLVQYGCEAVQGYLYSRPLAEETLIDYLQDRVALARA